MAHLHILFSGCYLFVDVYEDVLDEVEAVPQLLLLLGPILRRLDQRLDQQRVLGYPER